MVKYTEKDEAAVGEKARISNVSAISLASLTWPRQSGGRSAPSDIIDRYNRSKVKPSSVDALRVADMLEISLNI